MPVASLCITLQDAITLSQAADFAPGKPHTATVWRWATRGVRGVRLQTWTVGGRRFTTIDALDQFIQSLNAAGGVPPMDDLVAAECGRA